MSTSNNTKKRLCVTHSDKELLRRRVEDAGGEFLLRAHLDPDLLRRSSHEGEHRRVVLRQHEAGAPLFRPIGLILRGIVLSRGFLLRVHRGLHSLVDLRWLFLDPNAAAEKLTTLQ